MNTMLKPNAVDRKTIFGGLDVDDSNYHAAIFDLKKNEVTLQFKCAPHVPALIEKFKSHNINLSRLRLCYESSYGGSALYRELTAHGIQCDVIATSKIPITPGNKVKTDRIDSCKLARNYAKGDLTIVHVHDPENEYVRDLIRSRHILVDESVMLKEHFTALCKRCGLDFRKETNTLNASYWTQAYTKWIEVKVNALDDNSPFKFNLQSLLGSLNNLLIQIERYENKIKEISYHEKYYKACRALECFRGLNTLSCMILITEIGDIKRFDHPRRLFAYAGFSITEYSSGGYEKKYHITKAGNKFIRTAVVEASQFVFRGSFISKQLSKRRLDADPESVNIADRCMERLHKKAMKMFHCGKHRNKIKVACAREMLGFIWEALTLCANKNLKNG